MMHNMKTSVNIFALSVIFCRVVHSARFSRMYIFRDSLSGIGNTQHFKEFNY